MKVINICRFLPIEGFPAENDITLKIYADLKDEFGVETMFVMPLAHIPKWATILKYSLKERYKTINKKNYVDSKYQIPIRFFEQNFPLPFRLKGQNVIKNNQFQFLLYKKSLYSLVKNFQPDIIHAHTIDDAFYAYMLFKKFGIPYVATLRGIYGPMYDLPIIKSVLQSAKYIISPSYNLKENFKLHNAKCFVDLIAHGIDNSWYLSEEKKYDSSCIRLVTTSRLLEMKNIHIVIQSLYRLKQDGYNLNYDIIGEGPYRKKLEALVQQLKLDNEVLFHGYQNQEKIKEIYSYCDIFIMLSDSETFGRAYFEAAAQGLLVIGTKNTGADGYFNKDEAYFIEPKTSKVHALLKKLDGNKFKKMTSASRKKVLNFKNEIIVGRYYNILENVKNNLIDFNLS